MRFATATITGLLFFSVAVSAAPSERPELVATWQSKICSESFDSRPSAFWQEGVFDAQVEGRILSPPTGREITQKMVQNKARSMANIFRYQGYVGGVCPDGNAWIVTTPAPAALKKKANGWQVPLATMNDNCRQVHAWFVPRSAGHAHELTIHDSGSVMPPAKRAGTLSVECLPKRPRWLGKQVWFLAPIGEGPSAEIPYQSLLAGETGLLSWINAVRRDVNLGPVVLNDAVQHAAGVLAIEKKLAHDRSLLKKVSDDLRAKKIHLLGENRVAGSDLAHMAWLLWNSPSHRNLLLHKEASTIGISRSVHQGEPFAVMALASSRALTTAKRPK